MDTNQKISDQSVKEIVADLVVAATNLLVAVTVFQESLGRSLSQWIEQGTPEEQPSEKKSSLESPPPLTTTPDPTPTDIPKADDMAHPPGSIVPVDDPTVPLGWYNKETCPCPPCRDDRA